MSLFGFYISFISPFPVYMKKGSGNFTSLLWVSSDNIFFEHRTEGHFKITCENIASLYI